MLDEQKTRLQDLLEAPWRRYSALARDRIPELSSAEAAHCLRSHVDSRIRDENEVALRSSFDCALGELQLLELAVVCGYFSLADIRSVALADFELLLKSRAAVEYLQIYDYLTIRFLAARLGHDFGLPVVKPPPINTAAALRFATFLSLHADFSESAPLDRFLRILDDFRFVKLVDSSFLKKNLANPDDVPLDNKARHVFEEATLGMFEFVDLLSNVFLQLEENEIPLFGCFYSYWLGQFFGERRVSGVLVRRGVCFEDVSIHVSVWPEGGDEPTRSGSDWLQTRIALLRNVWEHTKTWLGEDTSSVEPT